MTDSTKNITVFIEIPEGSHVKYERDEKTGMLMADRILHTPMSFPFNYGCVLGTQGEDGDPTDIVLLASERLVPGVGIKAQLIGMLEMEDEEGQEGKKPISEFINQWNKFLNGKNISHKKMY